MTEITHWSTGQVAQWLQSIQMHAVVPLFKQNAVEGPLLVRLDDDMLVELGIDSKVRHCRATPSSRAAARAHATAVKDSAGCRGEAHCRPRQGRVAAGASVRCCSFRCLLCLHR